MYTKIATPSTAAYIRIEKATISGNTNLRAIKPNTIIAKIISALIIILTLLNRYLYHQLTPPGKIKRLSPKPKKMTKLKDKTQEVT